VQKYHVLFLLGAIPWVFVHDFFHVQPPFNFAGMNVKEIMDKNPRDRTEEEKDMVLLHIRLQKEEEASK
jgi:hypothetical protein